jgi:hypothetical protein
VRGGCVVTFYLTSHTSDGEFLLVLIYSSHSLPQFVTKGG